ncbi:MAG: 2-oxo acid dehydrogenase subunit E2 [Chloroflexi bacterium]|nr:2-oxo acid dehydrogenase subunit E2 [Chloroflexota bacterium]
MAVSLVMPMLGDVMEKGTVSRWFKTEGEWVEKGTPIFEVTTDKITYEVEAVDAGVLKQVTPVGQVVPVGGLVGYLLAKGEPVPAVSTAEAPAAVAKAPLKEPEPAPAHAVEARVKASPAARRAAVEHKVDLSQVVGTGPEGRITEDDVIKFVEASGKAKAAPPGGKTIALTGIRKAVAERMWQSLHTMAQLTIAMEVDMTDAVKLRERLISLWEKAENVRVTYTDLIIKAVAMALKEHPLLNSTIAGDELHLLEDINVGMAVAIEGGLIVPVVHHADKKGLLDIAKETKVLAEKARSGDLSLNDVSRGTFTVTTLGVHDVEIFTPIVNPPEVAVLGVGRLVEKPVVYKGEIARRMMMYLSLSFDHRAMDGVPAAAFLRRVKEILERPELIYLFEKR